MAYHIPGEAVQPFERVPLANTSNLVSHLGVDPHPFAAIPERPKHHVRFHRIAERIRAEEAGLVEYLGTIVHDLQRRIRVRKAKHQW